MGNVWIRTVQFQSYSKYGLVNSGDDMFGLVECATVVSGNVSLCAVWNGKENFVGIVQFKSESVQLRCGDMWHDLIWRRDAVCE
jgi:hypothetical protein